MGLRLKGPISIAISLKVPELCFGIVLCVQLVCLCTFVCVYHQIISP